MQFSVLQPWFEGRAAGKAHLDPIWQEHRNVDIVGNTPVLGLGVPTNYPRKKMFSFFTRAGSDGSETFGCRLRPYGAFITTDDGWHTPCDSPPAPPGSPSTPQSSWQPYSNANAPLVHMKWPYSLGDVRSIYHA